MEKIKINRSEILTPENIKFQASKMFGREFESLSCYDICEVEEYIISSCVSKRIGYKVFIRGDREIFNKIHSESGFSRSDLEKYGLSFPSSNEDYMYKVHIDGKIYCHSGAGNMSRGKGYTKSGTLVTTFSKKVGEIEIE
jgi:hypothetical protein